MKNFPISVKSLEGYVFLIPALVLFLMFDSIIEPTIFLSGLTAMVLCSISFKALVSRPLAMFAARNALERAGYSKVLFGEFSIERDRYSDSQWCIDFVALAPEDFHVWGNATKKRNGTIILKIR